MTPKARRTFVSCRPTTARDRCRSRTRGAVAALAVAEAPAAREVATAAREAGTAGLESVVAVRGRSSRRKFFGMRPPHTLDHSASRPAPCARRCGEVDCLHRAVAMTAATVAVAETAAVATAAAATATATRAAGAVAGAARAVAAVGGLARVHTGGRCVGRLWRRMAEHRSAPRRPCVRRAWVAGSPRTEQRAAMAVGTEVHEATEVQEVTEVATEVNEAVEGWTEVHVATEQRAATKARKVKEVHGAMVLWVAQEATVCEESACVVAVEKEVVVAGADAVVRLEGVCPVPAGPTT
jgi:hypothetical protein